MAWRALSLNAGSTTQSAPCSRQGAVQRPSYVACSHVPLSMRRFKAPILQRGRACLCRALLAAASPAPRQGGRGGGSSCEPGPCPALRSAGPRAEVERRSPEPAGEAAAREPGPGARALAPGRGRGRGRAGPHLPRRLQSVKYRSDTNLSGRSSAVRRCAGARGRAMSAGRPHRAGARTRPAAPLPREPPGARAAALAPPRPTPPARALLVLLPPGDRRGSARPGRGAEGLVPIPTRTRSELLAAEDSGLCFHTDTTGQLPSTATLASPLSASNKSRGEKSRPASYGTHALRGCLARAG